MLLTGHNFMAGKWTEIPEYDKALFDAGMKNGLFWHASVYLYWYCSFQIYQGKFNEAEASIQNLFRVWKQYDYLVAGGAFYGFTVELLLVRRRLRQTQVEANNPISLLAERGSEPWQLQRLGWKAVTQVLLKDTAGAEDSLTQAEQIRLKQTFWPPFYISSSLLAQFLLDLQMLEDAIGGDSRSLVSEYTKAALKSGKAAVKNSGKFAAHRTWNYQLMGKYYWLIGNQRKALKWFDKSIKEGERLGARPDLSRTYMEVGRRLLEPKSKYKELNGITATDYLEKAETMFKDMDLEWDLEELERVRT